MKIAIIGAGGVGGYFGGRWAEAGHDVHFLARGVHLDVLRRRGLRIESPLGDAQLGVAATPDPEAIGPADLVVVATKTWQLPAALDAVRQVVGPDSVVLGLQNGVEADRTLSGAAGPERVLGGTCRIISFVAEPGVIRHVGIEPTIIFGEVDGGLSGRVESIRDQLDGARGVTIEASPDIKAALWRKFLFFAPVSGIGSVTRVPIGVFRDIEPVRELLEQAVDEVLEVGRAHGVDLSPDDASRALAFIDTLPVEGTSSMQRDFRDGRRTELDALSGAVVRLGEAGGVATPTHAFMYRALLPLELEARGS